MIDRRGRISGVRVIALTFYPCGYTDQEPRRGAANIIITGATAMMKHILGLAIALAFLIPAADGVRAQAKKMSVLDYYLALPDDCFYCEIAPADLSKAFKKKQITKANLPAGYIEARSENYTMQVALFTAPGVTVVAVNRPCGAGCMCDMFRLLVPAAGGRWSDFTGFPSGDEVLARIGRKDLEHVEYVLPETGTDIKVIDPDTRTTLLLIGWSGGRFRIK